MNKAVSMALLAAGILLLIFGFQASDSIRSDVSRFFTGSPTDKAMWLLIVGVLCSVIEVIGFARGGRGA